MNELKARFPIGTQYMSGGKHPKLCTVLNIWKTYNEAGNLVQIRYLTYHEFLGQRVINHDVIDTTIARGLTDEYKHLLK